VSFRQLPNVLSRGQSWPCLTRGFWALTCQLPSGILIGSTGFAGHRHADHATCVVCSNRPHCAMRAMQPRNVWPAVLPRPAMGAYSATPNTATTTTRWYLWCCHHCKPLQEFTRFIWWIQTKCQVAVNPQTNPTNLDWVRQKRQLLSASTVAIYY